MFQALINAPKHVASRRKTARDNTFRARRWLPRLRCFRSLSAVQCARCLRSSGDIANRNCFRKHADACARHRTRTYVQEFEEMGLGIIFVPQLTTFDAVIDAADVDVRLVTRPEDGYRDRRHHGIPQGNPAGTSHIRTRRGGPQPGLRSRAQRSSRTKHFTWPTGRCTNRRRCVQTGTWDSSQASYGPDRP